MKQNQYSNIQYVIAFLAFTLNSLSQYFGKVRHLCFKVLDILLCTEPNLRIW